MSVNVTQSGVKESRNGAGPIPAVSLSPLEAERKRRVEETFIASRVVSPRFHGGDSRRLNDSLRRVTDKAAFYYKWPTIPNWPPHLLLRKILRKLLQPLLYPIAEFNLAARDALKDLRDRVEAVNDDQRELVEELEQRVEDLQGQVQALSGQIAVLTAASEAGKAPVPVREEVGA